MSAKSYTAHTGIGHIGNRIQGLPCVQRVYYHYTMCPLTASGRNHSRPQPSVLRLGASMACANSRCRLPERLPGCACVMTKRTKDSVRRVECTGSLSISEVKGKRSRGGRRAPRPPPPGNSAKSPLPQRGPQRQLCEFSMGEGLVGGHKTLQCHSSIHGQDDWARAQFLAQPHHHSARMYRW